MKKIFLEAFRVVIAICWQILLSIAIATTLVSLDWMDVGKTVDGKVYLSIGPKVNATP